MNYPMIRYILAWVFTFEGMFLMLPAIVGGIYGEKQGLVYLAIAAGCLLVGTLSRIGKIRSKVFYSKEGFVAVSLSWIIMSLVGALPFLLQEIFLHTKMHFLKQYQVLQQQVQVFCLMWKL